MQTVKQKIVYFIVRAPPRLLWRTVATYKILRLANFPIAGVRVPPRPLFEDKSLRWSSSFGDSVLSWKTIGRRHLMTLNLVWNVHSYKSSTISYKRRLRNQGSSRTYKTVSSVRFPISSLRVPSKFIPNKFLRHSIEWERTNSGCWTATNIMGSAPLIVLFRKKKNYTHSDVTLEFLSHVIPSHLAQGSLDFLQLAGTFFVHFFIKDLSAAAASAKEGDSNLSTNF